MNEDFCDILSELQDSGARFLVVGAHALAVHGVPRATGDLDIWIEASPANAARVWKALLGFGAPIESMNLSVEDLHRPNQVIQIGLPPRRIDLLTALTGVDFETAWSSRVIHTIEAREVPFLGRDELIRNKRALGRHRDLADLESLGETPRE